MFVSKFKKKDELGLSLIESSMVLALSAIVVSGVMFYYQSASDSNKTQNTTSEIMSAVSAVNGLYVGQSNYDGLQKSVLSHSSAIPENYKTSDGNISNPFGGQLDVAPSTDKTKYALQLSSIPASSCVNIASMNLGTSMVGVAVSTNGSSIQEIADKQALAPSNSQDVGQLYTSLTPVQAAGLCGDSGTMSITFVMN
ncbi:pilus assembly protein [Escherichia coli]|uniref:type 4 pilus major pilin n=1 Tax=Escherichia coli TaxID=562 RepID=UPI0019D1A103|nr:type 4 pilus major pilin [Escherichia coli]MBN6416932.1 pilus assembly protein [Escherichia coli]